MKTASLAVVGALLPALALTGGVAAGVLSLEHAVVFAFVLSLSILIASCRAEFVLLGYLVAAFMLAAWPGRASLPVETAALFGAAVLFRWLTVRRDRALRSGLSLTLMAFTLSALATVFKTGPAPDAAPWLLGPAVALVILRAPRDTLPSQERALSAALFGVSATLAWDLMLRIRMSGSDPSYYHLGRFMGSIADYELAGEYYALAGLLAIAVYLLDNRLWMRRLSLGALSASVLLILSTQTRGAMLIFGAGAIAMVALGARRAEMRPRVMRLGVVATIAIVVGGAQLVATDAVQRLLTSRVGGGVATDINRASTWRAFTQLAEFDRSGALGHGFEYPYEVLRTYPHSLYLWSIWSMGWVGTALLVAVALSAVVLLARGWQQGLSAPVASAVIILLLFVDQIKIEVGRGPDTAFFLWGLVALGVLLHRVREQPSDVGERASSPASGRIA